MASYFTTPIYYVNDRPHIGHCYTTLVADVAARAQRLIDGSNDNVFFLTGTDEHAEKVAASAQAHGVSPIEWADTNAVRFKEAFDFMGFSHDDFIRTTEERHTSRASAMIAELMDRGAIELGDYEGWYDPSQEEYVTETTAKEHDFKSPVTGKPLEQRTEQNYFFDLPAHEGWLREQIESDAIRVLPEARKNEILGRIRQGLNRVPVSRHIKEGDPDWGIKMPGDDGHRIYVWIEALCNYMTAIDTDERRRFWAGGSRVTHFMAKDIIWFHAVIWPAMLHALGKTPPSTVYAHAYWIAEGKKMSKSLGNFIEIDQLRAYADRYSLDAVRWYLMTQGPLGATDADFAHSRFVEVYNADLANGIGNSTSRVSNMIAKYFDGAVAKFDPTIPIEIETDLAFVEIDLTNHPKMFKNWVQEVLDATDRRDAAEALSMGTRVVDRVDQFISETRPFSLAKKLDADPGNESRLAMILFYCAEMLRIASLFLYPAMPEKMAELWRRWNCNHLTDPSDHNSPFAAPLEELARFGDGPFSLEPGQQIEKGDALFMRADPSDPAPTAASAE